MKRARAESLRFFGMTPIPIVIGSCQAYVGLELNIGMTCIPLGLLGAKLLDIVTGTVVQVSDQYLRLGGQHHIGYVSAGRVRCG